MGELQNKRILLIALHGYSDGIVKKMRQMGAEVDYFNDKPNDGVICKTLGRLKFKPYMPVIRNYYKKFIYSLAKKRYDYILVVRGEYTPEESLLLLKQSFPKAKLILYMWDSVRNNKGIEKKWNYYDVVYTFDRIDYLHYKDQLKFLPLYYYEDYLPTPRDESEHKKYDIAFIGTGHEDRVKIAKEVQKQCQQEKRKSYIYIFLPHKLVYYRNKIFNKFYKNVSQRDIHYKMLPTKEAYQIYSEAKCVMDVESSTQCGLTMRTIEMIGLRKKLITTNADIVNYDFYNKDNILVVDRKKFRLDEDFLDKPYVQMDDAIYQKYTLRNWINEVLK